MRKQNFSICVALAFFASALLSFHSPSLTSASTSFDFIPNRFIRGFGSDEKPTIGGKSVSDIIKTLGNEYEPLLNQPSTSGSRSREERSAERHQSGVITEETFSSTETRFMGKHLFDGGKYDGEPRNSFNEFSENPDFLKKYIVKVNRKVFSGKVLTDDKLLLGNLKNTKGKQLTVIDSKIEVLQADIEDEVSTHFY